ncbi:Far upstream element-binding protein 1 [Dirofilaria immitis]|nr:Far upstream element-binding protein 1 [Dirofilaria immitis]
MYHHQWIHLPLEAQISLYRKASGRAYSGYCMFRVIVGAVLVEGSGSSLNSIDGCCRGMSTGIISTDAIQDALQRAKELAASSHSNPQKRPNSDDSSNLYPTKRVNITGNAMDMGGSMQISTLGGPGHVGTGGMPPVGGVGEVVMETMEVPDHCVGLGNVIGRGGEQISQIQSQTNCRVQMSPESDGNNMRQCTLQGSKMSVDRARAMINEVIARAGNRPPPNRAGHFDGGIPVGTGHQITQEMFIPGAKCGTNWCQNGNDTGESGKWGQPKPLRITGEPEKVENARRMVEEILQSREDHPPGHFGFPGSFGISSGQRSIGEIIVPRASVGMIIGKGGETIKRLAAESGAKIQFKPDDDQTSQERCAIIQGTSEQIDKATKLIIELVRKSGAAGGAEMFYMHVPSNKTGLICAESGAHVELSRDPPPNASEKVFIIKGTPYQIHHAQHIIRIKVGDIAPGTPVPQFNGRGGPGAGGDACGVGHNAVPSAPQGYGNGNAQFAGAGIAGQAGAQWNTTFGHQQSDPAQAAWNQQYYGQQGQQQPGYQQGAYAAQYQQPVQPQPQPAQTSAAPAVNPQTGQPDYSAQWAEYYRSMGMHEQAAVIENQLKQNAAAAAAAQQPAAQARPQQPGYGAYGAQPITAQNQFSYGAPQAQPQGGYQFQQQY